MTLRVDEHGRRAIAVERLAPARPADVAAKLAVDPAWIALGPYGGDVSDVAAQPGAENVVLAGIAPSTGFGGTMFRSSDGGATWSDSSTGLAAGAQGTSLSVSAFDPNLVYLADNDFGAGGVYQSFDGGQTWSSAGFAARTFAVFADSLRAGRLFIAQQSSGPKASRSEDGGATFAAFDAGLATAGTINGATYDAGACGRMLLATGTGAYARTASCPLEGDRRLDFAVRGRHAGARSCLGTLRRERDLLGRREHLRHHARDDDRRAHGAAQLRLLLPAVALAPEPGPAGRHVRGVQPARRGLRGVRGSAGRRSGVRRNDVSPRLRGVLPVAARDPRREQPGRGDHHALANF